MKSCNLLFISTVLFTVLIFGCTRKPSKDVLSLSTRSKPNGWNQLIAATNSNCWMQEFPFNSAISPTHGYKIRNGSSFQIRVLIFSTLTATCFPNYREKGGPPMNISPYGTLGPKTTRFAYSIPTDKKFFDTISMAISSPPLRSKDHTEKPFNICTH